MSKILNRIKQQRRAGGRKGFTEPNFWTLDHLRSPFFGGTTTDKEKIENDFAGYIQGAYKRNGAVFACMAARQMVFSEARFLWRRFEKGRPNELFGSKELALLENPWPGGTTGELLAHMIQDADLAGNAFVTTTDDSGKFGAAATGPGRRLVRMRPDWVEMILGSRSGDLKDLDTRVIVYRYKAPGPGEHKAVDLLPSEVAHFSPSPDPDARFRGMSWLTPILREIESDSAATVHKKKFFENAAVPNMAVKFDKDTGEDEFDEFVAKFKESHQGAMNAYKTLFLMGGADITPLTMDFDQLQFNQTIGKGESRIAAAAGVPSTWVGFSEGLSGSGLNSQGVYAAARRRYADGTMRPLWRMVAASLEVLLDVPAGAALWYDDRDIAFLREDAADRAEIFRLEMAAISSGIMAGFKTDAMVLAARDQDVMKLLGQHSGLTSVQMVQSRPEHQAEQDEAEIFAARANTVNALASSGRFTPESVVEAVEATDLTLLKKAELPKQQPGQAAGAPGQPGAPQAAAQEPEEPAPEDEDSSEDSEGGSDKPKPKPKKPKPKPGDESGGGAK